MKDEWSAKFTADFVVKQMQSDRWISRQSQLLFIRTHIYNEITGTYLYDWSDGDENRLDEYGNAVDYAEKCWKDFRSWYIAYTKQQSAEYDRQSAEARQQSAEARQQSINALNEALEWVIDFYKSYKKSPDPKRLKSFKPKVKELISRCKDLNIDYRAKLSPEMLKFYGIEQDLYN